MPSAAPASHNWFRGISTSAARLSVDRIPSICHTGLLGRDHRVQDDFELPVQGPSPDRRPPLPPQTPPRQGGERGESGGSRIPRVQNDFPLYNSKSADFKRGLAS